MELSTFVERFSRQEKTELNVMQMNLLTSQFHFQYSIRLEIRIRGEEVFTSL